MNNQYSTADLTNLVRGTIISFIKAVTMRMDLDLVEWIAFLRDLTIYRAELTVGRIFIHA